ncbi:MAG TPA: type II toxin-antitoxin system HicA family toxin [Terriglobia bacterium]|nr:type II toxin-antitoxin system HicA family toxin [Terriglobia bacterium]
MLGPAARPIFWQIQEREGFRLVKEKGSVRYYARVGNPYLIRVDFYGSKEVPTGTCHAILKAAGIGRGEQR